MTKRFVSSAVANRNRKFTSAPSPLAFIGVAFQQDSSVDLPAHTGGVADATAIVVEKRVEYRIEKGAR